MALGITPVLRPAVSQTPLRPWCGLEILPGVCQTPTSTKIYVKFTLVRG